jgi:hypothetical protein
MNNIRTPAKTAVSAPSDAGRRSKTAARASTKSGKANARQEVSDAVLLKALPALLSLRVLLKKLIVEKVCANDIIPGILGFDLSQLAGVQRAVQNIVTDPPASVETRLTPFRRQLIFSTAAAVSSNFVPLRLHMFLAILEKCATSASDSKWKDDIEYVLRALAVHAAYDNFGAYNAVLGELRPILEVVAAQELALSHQLAKEIGGISDTVLENALACLKRLRGMAPGSHLQRKNLQNELEAAKDPKQRLYLGVLLRLIDHRKDGKWTPQAVEWTTAYLLGISGPNPVYEASQNQALKEYDDIWSSACSKSEIGDAKKLAKKIVLELWTAEGPNS